MVKTFLAAVLLILLLIPVFKVWIRRRTLKDLADETARQFLDRIPEKLLKSRIMTPAGLTVLSKLYRPDQIREMTESFRRQRVKILYAGLVAAAAAVFAGTLIWQDGGGEVVSLARGAADGSSYQEQLHVRSDDNEKDITVTVAPRLYDEEETGALIERTEAYIDETLPGENDSLTDVSQPLDLEESMPGENVSISWEISDYNVIRSDGSLGDVPDDELPEEVTLTAVISYGDETFDYPVTVTVTGRQVSEEDAFSQAVLSAVEAADDASSEEDSLELPSDAGGYSLTWYENKQSPLPLFAGLILIIVIWQLSAQNDKAKKALEKRKLSLMQAYPDFVHQMVLMLGAGMTVRRSMEQILRDEEKRAAQGKEVHDLYQELSYACHRIRTGIPEIRVYQEFAGRTGLACYGRFCQLLVQDLRKGSRGIQEMMMNEARTAMLGRRDTARKAGEEAGTKLLLPMMLLLVVVLLLVIMPAFLSI